MNKIEVFKIDLNAGITSNTDIISINNVISKLNIISMSTSTYLNYLIITIVYKEGLLNE